MEMRSEKLMSEKGFVGDFETIAQGNGADAGQKIPGIPSNLARLREKFVEAERAVEAKAKASAKAVDGYVHENPWKSIGVAAGAGLLIGLLLNRKR